MKDSLNIDGKTYISSRRAAEISRYSNDYIGQLCRGGKVNARMMGRTWFVDQESLLTHKKTSDEAFQARCRNASRDQSQAYSSPKVADLPKATTKTTIPASDKYCPSPQWTFTYSSDARPLLPEIKKASSLPLSPVAAPHQSAQRQAAVHQAVPPQVVSVRSSSRHYLSLAVLVVIIFTSVGFILNNNGVQFARIISEPGSQTAGVLASLDSALSSVRDIFNRTVDGIAGIFSPRSRSVARNTEVTNPSTVSPIPDWNGVAVVPQSASVPETERRIRDSFSDPVVVKPDQSGTAGVITPVFKQTNGDDFMYVLVPVKEEKK